MTQNDSAVVTAAVGYVYIGDVGTSRPSASAVANLDPSAWDSQSHSVQADSTPTAGTFKFNINGAVRTLEGVVDAEVPGDVAVETLPGEADPVATPATKDKSAKVEAVEPVAAVVPKGGAIVTPDMPYTADATYVQGVLEELVGVGNVLVTGDAGSATKIRQGFNISWVGELKGAEVSLEAVSALTSGTYKVVIAVSDAVKLGAWQSVGHTSRGD